MPTSPQELKSFWELESYYHQFIPKFTDIANCLHQLVSPTNYQKGKKSKKGEPLANQSNKTFSWTGEHQEAPDLKSPLTSTPVLCHPDFSESFEPETDIPSQGLGTILSVWDKNGKSHIIAYASGSLWPNEQSMQNYNSAKLELLVLKWAVKEKLRDYLSGSKLTVYTDNNPLIYVKQSKLGMGQIWWLSELAIFDFNMKYRTDKSDQAADALSHNPKPINDDPSDTENEEYVS